METCALPALESVLALLAFAGLSQAVVGGEVTEGQPGLEGTGDQPRWGGDLGVLCPRLRIGETTKEPTPMQTHEG